MAARPTPSAWRNSSGSSRICIATSTSKTTCCSPGRSSSSRHSVCEYRDIAVKSDGNPAQDFPGEGTMTLDVHVAPEQVMKYAADGALTKHALGTLLSAPARRRFTEACARV